MNIKYLLMIRWNLVIRIDLKLWMECVMIIGNFVIIFILVLRIVVKFFSISLNRKKVYDYMKDNYLNSILFLF